MAKKTAGVQALVEDTLNLIDRPYGEDIIEEVFIKIQDSTDFLIRYNELLAELGRKVVNQQIGKYTKNITGYQTKKQVDTKRASLTTSYSKLNP